MLDTLAHALRSADVTAAATTLHDDVTLWVAVHDQPFRGVAATRAILEVVLDGPLHDIEPAEAMTADGGVEVLTFTAGVAGYADRADGLLLARPGAGGLIDDLTVFLRPLPALAALADEMGRRFGGPRPA